MKLAKKPANAVKHFIRMIYLNLNFDPSYESIGFTHFIAHNWLYSPLCCIVLGRSAKNYEVDDKLKFLLKKGVIFPLSLKLFGGSGSKGR